MKHLKLGSLFDGSGGFPLAGALNGIEPVWASEVEPYPIAVTTSRFPHMKHLGDVSKVNGAEIEPVDIITFGSPCQDMSVAGKRAGIKHEDHGDEETTRSGLFYEAIRIIKEMRYGTEGRSPTFVVWENVPGAFSSNRGEDFRAVLEELVKIAEPTAVVPDVPQGGWAYADCWRGDGWSLAYRVFDAQHIRTAQRRKRIYLVLCLGDEDGAGKILFERDCLRGHYPQSGKAWERTASPAEGSVDADDREGAVCYGISSYESNSMKSDNPHSGIYVADTSRTLDGNGGNPACNQGGIVVVETVGYDGYNQTLTGDKTMSITGAASDIHHIPGAVIRYGACGNGDRHEAHIVAYQEKVGGLCARDYKGVGSQYVSEDKLVIENYVAYSFYPQMKAGSQCLSEEVANCVINGTNPGFQNGVIESRPPHYIVRRLTPTECARLQGFPDRWGDIDHKETMTDDDFAFWLEVKQTYDRINGRAKKDYTEKQILAWYNKLHNDGAEYKMWGNGIALPCALYVMEGIVNHSVGLCLTGMCN